MRFFLSFPFQKKTVTVDSILNLTRAFNICRIHFHTPEKKPQSEADINLSDQPFTDFIDDVCQISSENNQQFDICRSARTVKLMGKGVVKVVHR